MSRVLTPEQREKVKARKRAYRAANLEKVKASQREYYAAHPEQAKAYQREYRAANLEKVKASQRARKRAYYAANPEKVNASTRRHLAARYGLTVEAHRAMLASPCALCGRSDKPSVCDHSHQTGEVRGPLCRRCNTSIEALIDVPQWHVRAHAYLLSFDSEYRATHTTQSEVAV